MLNILTPKEMYAVDNYSINEYGVPSAILMETQLALLRYILKKLLENAI